MENFQPRRSCIKNEHECRNSYGYKICVKEKNIKVACAKYSKILCDDDKIFVKWIFIRSFGNFTEFIHDRFVIKN